MSAIRKALELYGPEFPSVHGLYLEHGNTYSEPGMLGLARPCDSTNYQKWVDLADADAWWVELAVGPNALGILYSHIPFPLARIGWARQLGGRQREPRFYNFQKVKRIINSYGL